MRALSLCIALAACAEFPALDGTISDAARAAPYPVLTPLAPVLAQADAPGTITPASVAEAEGRIAALRNRAAGLRAPVLSRPEAARLQRDIDTSALR